MIIRNAQVVADAARTAKDRRAVFVNFGATDGSVQVDLLLQQRLYQFGELRSIFVDTTNQLSGSNGARIETDSGQTIVVTTGTQGYYTVFLPYVSKLTISSNDQVNLILYDRDIAPNVWASSASGGSVPNPLPTLPQAFVGSTLSADNYTSAITGFSSGGSTTQQIGNQLTYPCFLHSIGIAFDKYVLTSHQNLSIGVSTSGLAFFTPFIMMPLQSASSAFSSTLGLLVVNRNIPLPFIGTAGFLAAQVSTIPTGGTLMLTANWSN